MTLPVILSPAATREFEAAAMWNEGEAGLGERFVERVQVALDLIGQSPELHATVYRDLRRVRVQGFPYNILYRILLDHVEVIAVVHNKRDPKIWQSRA